MIPKIIVDSIKDKLQEHSYFAILRGMEESMKYGSTGSEVLLSLRHYLKNLLNENPAAYKLIENEINAFNKYLESIGYEL